MGELISLAWTWLEAEGPRGKVWSKGLARNSVGALGGTRYRYERQGEVFEGSRFRSCSYSLSLSIVVVHILLRRIVLQFQTQSVAYKSSKVLSLEGAFYHRGLRCH